MSAGTQKQQTTDAVVGTSRRYERILDWGRPPKEVGFGKISAVALDSGGNVYIYQRDPQRRGYPPIVVFSDSGDYLRGFGVGFIGDPHGMHISAADDLYVVDRDGHSVLKLSLEGELILSLGDSRRPAMQAPFNHPNDVAVAEDGEIYVADGYGNSAIHRFTREGKHIQTWGNPGSLAGEFRVPHGIWVDEDDRVLVADRENNRVQVFTRDGEFVEEWTDYYRPTNIFIDSSGTIFVSDLTPRISVLDRMGELIDRIRPYNNNAHGIWGDAEGNVYLAATDGFSVEKFVLEA